MRYRLGFLVYDKSRTILLQESRRYAGHSKWQNIKHVKEEHDRAKSKLFQSMIIQMKCAIQETGVSDPSKNLKLSQLVANARKANMPATTLTKFLSKMNKTKDNAKNELQILYRPGGPTLVIHIFSDVPKKIQADIFYRAKKYKYKATDHSALSMFDCASYITVTKNDWNLDQAMEDAIKMNAHDVIEIKEDDEIYFEFKCDFGTTNTNTSHLTQLGYKIINAEKLCLPKNPIELNEKDLDEYEKFKARILDVEDVDKIDDNVLQP